MVLIPTQDFNLLLNNERIFDPLFEKNKFTSNEIADLQTYDNIKKTERCFQQNSEDEMSRIEGIDRENIAYLECNGLMNNNVHPIITRSYEKENHFLASSCNDGMLCLPQERKRTFALSAKDFSNKRSSVCIVETLSTDDDGGSITDEQHNLSKSWSNLENISDDRNHHYSKAKKRLSSLFTFRGSTTSLDSIDTDAPRHTERIKKSRTPSLLRKFSTATKFHTKLPQSMSLSTTELHVSVVHVVPDHRPIKKSRSFSLRGSHNKLFGAISSEAINELPSNALDVPSHKHFIGLRSPFSKPKFDKDSAKIHEKVYEEMLKSILDGNCKRLKLLIKRRKTDINTIEYGSSLIHEAAFKGCVKCVKALIKAGWSVEFADESGWRPLHAAVFSESLETVKALLHYSANPNSLTMEGFSPLHIAVYNDDLYTTHELIKNGSCPLVESHFHVTPFQLAINIKTELVLDYLVLQPCFIVDTSVQ